MEAVVSSKISEHLIATQRSDPKYDHGLKSIFMKAQSKIAIFVTNVSSQKSRQTQRHMFMDLETLLYCNGDIWLQSKATATGTKG